MKAVIVGAGSIGRVFGTLLARGGHDVWFVEKDPEGVSAINERGLGIIDFGMEDPDAALFSPARAVSDPGEIDSPDLVILAVKSYDTARAVRAIAPLVGERSPILSLQTGLGNLEVMETIVGRANIIGGFTYMTGIALGPDRVKHSGVGATVIGELDGTVTPRLESLGKTFNQCAITTEITDDVVARLWDKVIVYAALNSVSAVLRIRNGRLLEEMEAITLMKRLVDEGREVALARGIFSISPDLYGLLFDTCRRTAFNMSSMLQDVINRKPTEIDALNGMLCRYGAGLHVDVPTHRTMVELVKLVEKWDQCYGGDF